MLSTTPPDATAFTARFLAQPEDRLGRLVFADWLEERGGESNTAWARYLREVAHVEEEFGAENAQQAGALGRAVRARLTLGRVPGTSLLSRLQLFLPARCVWVRIGDARTPQSALDICPENFARLYRFMPIDALGDLLFGVVAVERAEDFYSVKPDVENFLCCRVTAFRGFSSDVSRAIEAHQGTARLWSAGTTHLVPETESW